jgi:hypothetical protein
MRSTQIDAVCESLSASVAEARAVFRNSLPVPEILNRFWGLQDNLSRLLEAIKDHPTETMQSLERYPRVLDDVSDMLERSANVQTLRNLAAVRESAESINSSLFDIHQARHARVMTASV